MSDFFRGPKTPRADAVVRVRSPLATGVVADTLELLNRAADAEVCDKLIAIAGDEVARIPALAAMVAEVLISDGRADAAQIILDAALAHVPQDLRLNQLYALGLRRSGHPDEALARLEALSAKYSEDEETLGIAAGALKASWESGHGPPDALARALKLYIRGFQISREHNLYLGVNAAALQLWQGDGRSVDRARRIVESFSARNAQLTAAGVDLAQRRDYYDIVTEAEARLLAGDDKTARTLYAQAFGRFAARKGDIEGTAAQANRSLVLLGGEAIT